MGTLLVGMYVGTEASAGLVGVEGGVTIVGQADMAVGGVCVMGVTTLTGLCVFEMTNGEVLTVTGGGCWSISGGEEWGTDVGLDGPEDRGTDVGLDGPEDGGVGGTAGLCTRGMVGGDVLVVMVVTVIFGVLFWAGLSGEIVTEEVPMGSGATGTVCTTATEGGGSPAVEPRTTAAEQLLYGPFPALLTQATRNLKAPLWDRSVTL